MVGECCHVRRADGAARSGDRDAIAELWGVEYRGWCGCSRPGGRRRRRRGVQTWLEVMACSAASKATSVASFLLFTIARRRAADHRRTLRRKPAVPMARPTWRRAAAAPQLGVDPSAAVEGDEAVALIRAMLPDHQAEIVLLRVVGGLNVDEVASIVGRSPRVRVQQHRALKRLADRMAVLYPRAPTTAPRRWSTASGPGGTDRRRGGNRMVSDPDCRHEPLDELLAEAGAAAGLLRAAAQVDALRRRAAYRRARPWATAASVARAASSWPCDRPRVAVHAVVVGTVLGFRHRGSAATGSLPGPAQDIVAEIGPPRRRQPPARPVRRLGPAAAGARGQPQPFDRSDPAAGAGPGRRDLPGGSDGAPAPAGPTSEPTSSDDGAATPATPATPATRHAGDARPGRRAPRRRPPRPRPGDAGEGNGQGNGQGTVRAPGHPGHPGHPGPGRRPGHTGDPGDARARQRPALRRRNLRVTPGGGAAICTSCGCRRHLHVRTNSSGPRRDAVSRPPPRSREVPLRPRGARPRERLICRPRPYRALKTT